MIEKLPKRGRGLGTSRLATVDVVKGRIQPETSGEAKEEIDILLNNGQRADMATTLDEAQRGYNLRT